MAKSIKYLEGKMKTLKLNTICILEGGLGTIKGGFSKTGHYINEYTCSNISCASTNVYSCSDSAACSGTNENDCTNSGNCNGTTNMTGCADPGICGYR